MRLDHLLSRVPIDLLRQEDLLKPEQASDTYSVQDSLAVARRYTLGRFPVTSQLLRVRLTGPVAQLVRAQS